MTGLDIGQSNLAEFFSAIAELLQKARVIVDSYRLSSLLHSSRAVIDFLHDSLLYGADFGAFSYLVQHNRGNAVA